MIDAILAGISLYVAYNLAIGKGARWDAITAYWVVLCMRNVFIAIRRACDAERD